MSRGDLVLLAVLGAYHGVNPAMGWLFAVSLGMQQGDRRAVWRALGPIAIGHEAALVLVAGVVLALGAIVDEGALRLGAAVVLIAFGLWRFAKPHAHPRWTTMAVRPRELTLWSFLMSSAHGAGLMVAPVLLGVAGTATASAHDDGPRMGLSSIADVPATAVGLLVHVGTMVVVMGTIAIVVYDRLGVQVLRRAWLNTDGIWAAAFIMAGVITLVT